MENLISQYKLFIYPLVVVVASVVLIVFLILPQLKGLFLGQGNLNEAQGRLNVLSVKATELESLNANDLSQKLEVALAALPTDKDFSALIGIFKGLAGSSGMNLTSLHLGGGVDQDGFTVKADMIGSATSLGNLLSSIETSPRVMRVQSMETTSSGLGNTIFTTLTVLVYFSPSPKTLGSVDSALPNLSDDDQHVLATLARTNVGAINQPTSLPSGKSNPFE